MEAVCPQAQQVKVRRGSRCLAITTPGHVGLLQVLFHVKIVDFASQGVPLKNIHQGTLVELAPLNLVLSLQGREGHIRTRASYQPAAAAQAFDVSSFGQLHDHGSQLVWIGANGGVIDSGSDRADTQHLVARVAG